MPLLSSSVIFVNTKIYLNYGTRSLLTGFADVIMFGKRDVVHGKCVRSWCDRCSDRSFLVDPLSYFSFQSVLHHWCIKGRGMCYSVSGMMHIKEL